MPSLGFRIQNFTLQTSITGTLLRSAARRLRSPWRSDVAGIGVPLAKAEHRRGHSWQPLAAAAAAYRRLSSAWTFRAAGRYQFRWGDPVAVTYVGIGYQAVVEVYLFAAVGTPISHPVGRMCQERGGRLMCCLQRVVRSMCRFVV